MNETKAARAVFRGAVSRAWFLADCELLDIRNQTLQDAVTVEDMKNDADADKLREAKGKLGRLRRLCDSPEYSKDEAAALLVEVFAECPERAAGRELGELLEALAERVPD